MCMYKCTDSIPPLFTRVFSSVTVLVVVFHHYLAECCCLQLPQGERCGPELHQGTVQAPAVSTQENNGLFDSR